MAKRKGGKKRSYRRKQNINVLGLAQGMIVGNAVTRGFFNTSIMEFITGRIDGKTGGGSSEQITLPEVFGMKKSHQTYGGIATNYDKFGGGFTWAVAQNLSRGGLPMLATIFLTPVAFKFGKKAMRPLLTPVNNAFRGSGVTLG